MCTVSRSIGKPSTGATRVRASRCRPTHSSDRCSGRRTRRRGPMPSHLTRGGSGCSMRRGTKSRSDRPMPASSSLRRRLSSRWRDPLMRSMSRTAPTYTTCCIRRSIASVLRMSSPACAAWAAVCSPEIKSRCRRSRRGSAWLPRTGASLPASSRSSQKRGGSSQTATAGVSSAHRPASIPRR